VRYFKPKLLAQLQERAQQKQFLKALNAWETSADAYHRHLAEIKNILPSGLKRLAASISLHDAEVIDISRRDRNQFTIIVQPESDPSRQVVLSYLLVEPAAISKNALPENVRSQPLAWLYDELEVDAVTGNGKTRPPLGKRRFTHSILLSNGWEIRLHFRGVTVSRPESLLQHGLSIAAV
jgi:hypothetical protein